MRPSGVARNQLCGVQEIALNRRQRDLPTRNSSAAPYNVSPPRDASRREVHSNLMRAPVWSWTSTSVRTVNLPERFPIRRASRGFAMDSPCRICVASSCACDESGPPNGQLIVRSFLRGCLHQRDIRFLDARCRNARQLRVRASFLATRIRLKFPCPSDERFLAAVAPGLRKRLPTPQQGIDEGASYVSRAGVNGHPADLLMAMDVVILRKELSSGIDSAAA